MYAFYCPCKLFAAFGLVQGTWTLALERTMQGDQRRSKLLQLWYLPTVTACSVHTCSWGTAGLWIAAGWACRRHCALHDTRAAASSSAAIWLPAVFGEEYVLPPKEGTSAQQADSDSSIVDF